MIVECSGNDSEGLNFKIILTKAEMAKLDYTPITVEIPASHTEYGTNTRIIIEKS